MEEKEKKKKNVLSAIVDQKERETQLLPFKELYSEMNRLVRKRTVTAESREYFVTLRANSECLFIMRGMYL